VTSINSLLSFCGLRRNRHLVEWLFQPTFQKNVRTFLEKSTDVSRKKYGRFREKVRTFFETFRCFCISLITNHLQMYKKRLKTVRNIDLYAKSTANLIDI